MGPARMERMNARWRGGGRTRRRMGRRTAAATAATAGARQQQRQLWTGNPLNRFLDNPHAGLWVNFPLSSDSAVLF